MFIYAFLLLISNVLALIFGVIATVFGAVFGVGAAALTNLPFGVDQWFIDGFHFVHLISVWIPPLGIMLGGFIAILTYKFIMLILHVTRILR